MSNKNELITLTFGDMAENHKGMEQIGEMREKGQGFHLDDLEKIEETMRSHGVQTELISLVDEAKLEDAPEDLKAHVLVMRGAVSRILRPHGAKQINMFEEQKALDYDKKAFMYGRVFNKHARWNLCFDEKSSDPDYETGKGRIVGYEELPIMAALMGDFEKYFGEKATGLKVESNYYYDTTKTGIGFHGDSERRIVIAARIGTASLPMHYQWYFKGNPVGEHVEIPLHPGDMYIMCEKAVGTDWHKKNSHTLRHATGAKKYVEI
jgi:hypothetical protein